MKGPFELPEYIKATGITRMRDTTAERDEQMKAKQKARERVRPKMGRMDIDYQVLHDAFFKYQTKPHMTLHGDLYYEGKEFELHMKEKRPGVISSELKVSVMRLHWGCVLTRAITQEALGMTEGAPPPWLINMQRYGPPPSYPALKIPCLNAPIPPGAQYGYHPGGWGKPPVDEFGRPLYGDVFGQSEDLMQHRQMVRTAHQRHCASHVRVCIV